MTSECPNCGAVYDFAVHERQIRAAWPVRCPACRFDKWPPPAAQEVSVDDKLQQTARPGRCYLKRCFPKALEFVYDLAELSDRIRLVHGTYAPNGLSESGRGNHAWVEIDKNIAFDPNSQKFYNRDSYYEAIEAIKEAEYTPNEAALRMLEAQSYGPWHRPSSWGAH